MKLRGMRGRTGGKKSHAELKEIDNEGRKNVKKMMVKGGEEEGGGRRKEESC